MTAIGLLITAFVYVCTQAQIFNDDYLNDYPIYPPDSEQETGYAKYQVQSGVDIVLKCNSTSCMHSKSILWKFKECQPDFRKEPCSKVLKSNNTQWMHIGGKNTYRKRCRNILELKNVTQDHSGLYRCMENQQTSRIFELDVIDPISKYRTQPPKLLDVLPANITVSQNLPVIIQCKVYSKQPPVIWWFKESDEFNYDIEYFNKYYNRINTSIQVYPAPQEFNVYLSKLRIYHAQEMDSGIYVCVAMTESGKDHKDVSVRVMTTINGSWDRTSFTLLFLIPLVFALIPATIWMCFYKRKHMRTKTIPKRNMYAFRSIASNSAIV